MTLTTSLTLTLEPSVSCAC
ncbi:unnamed protein product, partial [Vitis vinifera]|uniref:Uncharacterized protein n=1 Tax=Vitis vinifera TaxID=29760 RepID=D7T1J6_VITVI